jgi:Flp pilus assembly protein TadD
LPAWLLALLLALVTLALYWPATQCDFVNYDDTMYVIDNSHVTSGLTLANAGWAWRTGYAANWHPVTWLSHMLDCQMFGLKPWGHHLINMLLHASNTALVFLVFRRMTRATWRSLMVAALFGLHPLRVESVAWVTERKDVLSAFFGLLALMAYARYAQGRGRKSEGRRPKAEGNPKSEARSPKPEAAGPWSVVSGPSTLRSVTEDGWSLSHLPSPIYYLLSLCFFALGLLSKAMLVTVPLVMLLLDYWPLRRAGAAAEDGHHVSRFTFHVSRPALLPLFLEKLPFFALSAILSIVTFLVQQHGGAVAAVENVPLGARCGNALISYGRYLGKLFWPTELAVFYPRPEHWPLGQVLLAGGVILGLSVLVWVPRRRAPYLLVGWLWFLGTLVPVIGLVQVGQQAMADRYTYLPSLGLLILTVWGACELTRRWRYGVLALAVAGGAALVLCLALTRQQLGHWKDSETLFRQALAVTENNQIAHNQLGTALDKKGQMDEAIRQYQEAVRLKPDYADAHNNLGAALDEQGQSDEAIRQLQEALRLKPDHAEAHNNLGIALGKQGQTDEAIRQFQEAVRLKPDYADAHYDLSVALGRKGQTGEAIRQLQEALRLKPDYAEAHNNLGTAFYQQGRTGEAIRQFQEALRLNPEYAGARKNLDAALATKADSPPPPGAAANP